MILILEQYVDKMTINSLNKRKKRTTTVLYMTSLVFSITYYVVAANIADNGVYEYHGNVCQMAYSYNILE